MEAQRRVVLPQEPKTNLPYIFVPRVSDSYFYKLEAARASKVINSTGGSVELTWDDIITIAKDDQYGVKLTRGGKVTAPAPSAPILAALEAVPKVSSRPQVGAPAHQHGDKCPLCKELGQGFDSHARERCFVDPSSKMYRPEVRQRRL